MKAIIISIFISCAFPIIGGWEVSPECPDCKYPFNVSIQTNFSYLTMDLVNFDETIMDGHFCQGALVAPNWVLTAAQCVENVQDFSHIWAEIGLHSINNFESTADSISVENFYIHPNYNSDETWYYNYALIELSSTSSYEPIQLISDSTYEEIGDSVSVMGWGARSYFDFWIYDTPLFENINTIDDCLLTDPYLNVNESLLCLSQTDYTQIDGWDINNITDPGFPGGACWGDKGAPLVTQNSNGDYELLGNFYYGCTLEYPNQNKFTRTSLIKDWIYSYIGGPCFDGGVLDISIIFDEYPDDISWELWYKGQNPNGEHQYLVENGDDSNEQICISDEGVYEFIIYDENGDGLCCTSYPFGSYELTLDTGEWGSSNEQIIVQGGAFGFSESTLFAWPDLDQDLIIDSQDIAPNNQFLCGDQNSDNCDDCSSGIFNLENNCDLPGDINQDSAVDVLDIVLIVNYVIGDISLNQNQLILADFNGDSSINVLDIVQIMNVILN